MICLKCKKEYDSKRNSSKFCSTSCRVMWNRKNGNKKPKDEVTKFQLQVLYNSIKEMVDKISVVGLLAQPNIELTNNLTEPISFDKLIVKINHTDSFQDLLNGIPDLDTEYEYREYAKKIENSGLPKKQIDLLLLNMRSPKN